MTIIAWDGKTLAADRMETHGDTPMRTRKIYRVNHPTLGRCIMGQAGRVDSSLLFMGWMRGETEQPEIGDDNFAALVIDSAQKIWVVYKSLVFMPVAKKFWAIGSGVDYALGAMAVGATAEQAVRATITLDVKCGMGVDTLTLDKPHKLKVKPSNCKDVK